MKTLWSLVLSLAVCPVGLFAHPGGLDANGGHHDRKNGGYHLHRSPSPVRAIPSPRPVLTQPSGPSEAAKNRAALLRQREEQEREARKRRREAQAKLEAKPAKPATHTVQLQSGKNLSVAGARWEDDNLIVHLPSGGKMTYPREMVASVAEMPKDYLAQRNWTSADGKHTLAGSLVAEKNGWIKLKKPDGSTISANLSMLSQADRDFVAEWAVSRPDTILGKVTRVSDGDTLWVQDSEGESHKIRLQGIDAPEDGMPYSAKSKKGLSDKVLGKEVRVEWKERDKYRRVLGHIYLDDRWVNREMVADGWAWHYKKYSSDKRLADAEDDSRDRRDGLWAETNPVPPWEYRSNPRKYAHELQRPDLIESKVRSPEEPSAATQFWLNTSSGTRHNRGCQWYGKTKRGRVCGPSEGKACGICGG